MGLSASGSSSGNSSGEERSGQERRALQSGNSELMANAIAKLDAGELLGKDEILLLNGEQVEIYSNEAKARIQLTDEQRNFIKKYRRLIKNKEYAQQSRDKKKKYIFELEAELDFAKTSITKLQQDINDLSIKNAQLETENRSLHEELLVCREHLRAMHANTLGQGSAAASLSPPESGSNSPENANISYAAMASSAAYSTTQRPGYFVPMFAVCLMGLCLGLLFGPLAGMVPGLEGLVGLGNSTVDVFAGSKGTGRTLKSEINQQQNSFSGWVKSFFYGSYQGKSGSVGGGPYDVGDGDIADVINSVVGGRNGNDENEKMVPYEDLLIKKDLMSENNKVYDSQRNSEQNEDKKEKEKENEKEEGLDVNEKEKELELESNTINNINDNEVNAIN